MRVFYWIQLILVVLVVVDMLRRQPSVWASADRQRSFWVGLTGAAGLFGAGIFAIAAYLLLVLPRLQGSRSDLFPVSEAFRKG